MSPDPEVFERMFDAVEVEAVQALADNDLAAIVSVRGRMSRLCRRAGGDWPGRTRVQLLDRELGSAVTAQQLALRREQPVAIPERIARAALAQPGQ